MRLSTRCRPRPSRYICRVSCCTQTYAEFCFQRLNIVEQQHFLLLILGRLPGAMLRESVVANSANDVEVRAMAIQLPHATVFCRPATSGGSARLSPRYRHWRCRWPGTGRSVILSVCSRRDGVDVARDQKMKKICLI